MSLTHARLIEALHYNKDTGVFTSLIKRSKTPVGTIVGWKDSGYIKISLDGKVYRAHRLAVFYMTGSWPAHDTDHINGDGSDNRYENLRLATRGQNMMNIGLKKHNTSGWKGVSFYKKTGKWKSQIQSDGKKIGLGYFDDIKEAAEAYIFAALEMHGDYARLI